MKLKHTQIFLLASAAIAAAAGGYGLARFTTPGVAPTAHAEKESAHKEEGHDEAGEGVVMDAARITAAGILVQPVASAGLSGEVISQASVTPSPEGQAVLTARAAGSITRIHKRLGDPVRAGETVAVVESAEAAAITADRRVAGARVTAARQRTERERRLFEQKVSPRQDVETAEAELAQAEAEAARAAAAAGAARVAADGRSVVVSSPISGRITEASAALGAYVQPDTELFHVADPGRIQVEAAVSAADAERIRPGDPASIETGDRVISAVVRSVTPGLNPDTRAATVVLAPAAGAAVQPGQLLRARITPRIGAGTGIVVPEEAIQTIEGRPTVFVRTGTGFRPQAVTLGQRNQGRVVVSSGLRAGEQIAIKGSFLLKAELGKSEAEHDH